MKQIQRKRLKLGMTQADLAGALGVDPSTVAKWESEKAYPRADLLPKIAGLLGCTIDELYADEPEKEAG